MGKRLLIRDAGHQRTNLVIARVCIVQSDLVPEVVEDGGPEGLAGPFD